jgi:hypothetical protein
MDLQLIGGIVGVIVNIPLIISILLNKTKQSFITYALWSILDLIVAYSVYAQQGNFWLPFLYGLSAGLVSIILVLKKQFSWGLFEWFILVLVIICLVVQYSFGEFWSMIASVASLSIASIPQIINTYKRPKDTPFLIYLGFSLAGLISLLGGKSFELKEILYPISALFICLLIAILSKRNK